MASGSDGGEQLALTRLKVFAQGTKAPVAGQGLDHMQWEAAANRILSCGSSAGGCPMVRSGLSGFCILLWLGRSGSGRSRFAISALRDSCFG